MNRPARSRLLLASSAVLAFASAVLIAGPLDPPVGPIKSTYKTLDQIEPRIPISEATTPGDDDSAFRITAPGSYYLTGDVYGFPAKSGIVIAADNVTIDLMGFSLVGVPASLHGILNEGRRHNTTIRNGTIRDWGGDGVQLTDDLVGHGAVLTDLNVRRNGGYGCDVPDGAVIRGCTADDNGHHGFDAGQFAVYESCVAQGNGGTGIVAGVGSALNNCSARSNGGFGISASGSTVVGCAANYNGKSGFHVYDGTTITNSTAFGNTEHGIFARFGGATIRGNTCRMNGDFGDGAGIYVEDSDTRVDGNNCTNNDWGIRVVGAGNFIVRNTCSGNATNWDVAAGNVCYVIVADTSGAIVGDSGGVGPGSTNPQTNFTY